jgi:hypothetical protein
MSFGIAAENLKKAKTKAVEIIQGHYMRPGVIRRNMSVEPEAAPVAVPKQSVSTVVDNLILMSDVLEFLDKHVEWYSQPDSHQHSVGALKLKLKAELGG